MATDPEDHDDCYESFNKKLMQGSRDNGDELPESILRALQRTAIDMQDEELSGIMEDKIKQYVLTKHEHEDQKEELNEASPEEKKQKEHLNRPEDNCLQIDHNPLEIKKDEVSAISEKEIQQYIRSRKELRDAQNIMEVNDGATNLPKQLMCQPSQQQLVDSNLPDLPLDIGDHVYAWRSFIGIPGVFQHHGIVMDISRDEKGELQIKIADFSCILRAPNEQNPLSSDVKDDSRSVDMLTGMQNQRTLHPHGILRVYDSSFKDQKWHKVHYKANVYKTSMWRSGTCTCVEADPPAKVLARAYFLLEHPELLPPYHIFNSNCESVAVWCCTGKWCTLQASSLLYLTAAGQLKSTASLAAFAASQQVTVTAPAAGIWGCLGYTTSTQVSLLSTQPHLIPLLAAYGVVSAGAPTFVLWRAKSMWEQITKRLNEKFWEHAMKDPNVFANSMMYWSERHAAFERSK